MPGQILGGRWRPIHYEMRASTFNDHLATCNSAGACFVLNDSPFAFDGVVTVRLLNVLTGQAVDVSRTNVSLPPGPKRSHWFCAGASDEAAAEASETSGGGAAAYAVRPGTPSDRGNFTKTLTGKGASEKACETACNTDKSCIGFTQYMRDPRYGQDCWLYSIVPELVSTGPAGSYHEVGFHQRPGTPSIPSAPPPPAPRPRPRPSPPRPPAPPSPPPYPEPPQLRCAQWAALAAWNRVGCAAGGVNCVLTVDVHNSSQSKVSWSTLLFQPPKNLTLPAAAVKVALAAAPGARTADRINITLSTNTTALYVILTTAAQGRFSDNAVLLEANTETQLEFISWDGPLDSSKLSLLRSSLRVEHLAMNLVPPLPLKSDDNAHAHAAGRSNASCAAWSVVLTLPLTLLL